jgi:hypothetical protein
MQFTIHFSHKAIEVGKGIEIHVFHYWWSTYGNNSLILFAKMNIEYGQKYPWAIPLRTSHLDFLKPVKL